MNTVHAYQLNRRIQLQAPTVTRDPVYGSEQLGWSTVATVWAARIEAPGSESTQADQRVATRRVEYLIRYRADVLATWRVVEAGRITQLTASPAEVGVRRGLRLVGEQST